MGYRIHNATLGQSFDLLRTTDDSGGDFLDYEWIIAPQREVGGLHSHPFQVETIHVLEGNLSVELCGAEVRLKAGDTLLIPLGSPHRHSNLGTTPVRARVTLSPALDAEAWLRSLHDGDDSGALTVAPSVAACCYLAWPEPPVWN